MKSLAIPLDDLPLREELPAELLQRGNERWQRGVRVVDESLPEAGRITAGIWFSGRFATNRFTFGGCEWLHVLSGSVVFDIDNTRHEIVAGMSALVPRGLSCRWIQPEPVLKYFLRWDHDGDDQPTTFWSSALSENGPQAGRFTASVHMASWRMSGSTVTLLPQHGRLDVDGPF